MMTSNIAEVEADLSVVEEVAEADSERLTVEEPTELYGGQRDW